MDATPPPPKPPFDATKLLLTAVCILALLGSIAFVLEQERRGRRATRQVNALILIEQLTQAAEAYRVDSGAYPPGDGSGSAPLARALATPGPRKVPYFEFAADQLDPAGNIRAPGDEPGTFLYRCKGLHHPERFDLWLPGSTPEDDVTNWEPVR